MGMDWDVKGHSAEFAPRKDEVTGWRKETVNRPAICTLHPILLTRLHNWDQLVKKFLVFYGTRRFITVYTRTCGKLKCIQNFYWKTWRDEIALWTQAQIEGSVFLLQSASQWARLDGSRGRYFHLRGSAICGSTGKILYWINSVCRWKWIQLSSDRLQWQYTFCYHKSREFHNQLRD
jgi:hypothetical protein